MAVDSLYALNDLFFIELEKLSSEFSIEFFLTSRTGNYDLIIKIKKWSKKQNVTKIVEVESIQGTPSLFKTFFTILRNFYAKKYFVIIGDNVNPEQRILIKALSSRSIYFGIVPVSPPILHELVLGTNIDRNGGKRRIFTYLSILKIGIIEIFKSNLNLSTLTFKVLKKIILFFFGLECDSGAIKGGYLNKGLASAHFTPHEFWAHIIENQYKNEKVFFYEDQYLGGGLKENIQIGDTGSILVLGPSCDNHFEVILESISKLERFFKISTIDIRPHPRFIDNSLKISEIFRDKGYKSIVVSCEEAIFYQCDRYNLVLGYNSSVLISIINKKGVHIIIDELYASGESRVTVRDFPKLFGTFYGFNKEYIFLSQNGALFCLRPDNERKKWLLNFEFHKILEQQVLSKSL